jgi:2-phosphoglycerate kinase
VQPVVDLTAQAMLEKKDIKAQRVILEAIKDHLIPHVAEKTNSKDMFDALVSLFQSDNMSRKMILKTKLRESRMTHSNNVASYLMRITQIRDQLAAIGKTVLKVELVNVALNGFTKSWEPFIMVIYAREHLPKWES